MRSCGLHPVEHIQQSVAFPKMEGACLAAALQGAHDGDQLGGVGGRQRAAPFQDRGQLAVGDVAHVQLQEARAERARQHLRIRTVPYTL